MIDKINNSNINKKITIAVLFILGGYIEKKYINTHHYTNLLLYFIEKGNIKDYILNLISTLLYITGFIFIFKTEFKYKKTILILSGYFLFFEILFLSRIIGFHLILKNFESLLKIINFHQNYILSPLYYIHNSIVTLILKFKIPYIGKIIYLLSSKIGYLNIISFVYLLSIPKDLILKRRKNKEEQNIIEPPIFNPHPINMNNNMNGMNNFNDMSNMNINNNPNKPNNNQEIDINNLDLSIFDRSDF